ncbi:hypothetical protein IX38_16810 [Chryseobacterium luteum]|uniref:Uncharacterized protein n=1 Tax=Chryseobacterium luteum TaxID=421531 RepID=A0A085ZBB3_9FLAO|nr:hypothetical protein IX38_16810 [Chryseobacterium luteum]
MVTVVVFANPIKRDFLYNIASIISDKFVLVSLFVGEVFFLLIIIEIDFYVVFILFFGALEFVL